MNNTSEKQIIKTILEDAKDSPTFQPILEELGVLLDASDESQEPREHALHVVLEHYRSVVPDDRAESEWEKLWWMALFSHSLEIQHGRELGFEKHFSALPELFDSAPGPITLLKAGQKLKLIQKQIYFADRLALIPQAWVADYCIESAVLGIGDKKNLRTRLIETGFIRLDNPSQLLLTVAKSMSRYDRAGASRLKSAIKLTKTMHEVIERRPDCKYSEDFGKSLSEWSTAVLIRVKNRTVVKSNGSGRSSDLFEYFETLLDLLMHVLRQRLTLGLLSSTYEAISTLQTAVSRTEWRQYISHSRSMVPIRVWLLDAALMLGRQNKTDNRFLDVLVRVHETREALQISLERKFKNSGDIETGIQNWWITTGKEVVAGERRDQKVDITVDRKLALLLLAVKGSIDPMEKVKDGLIPLLESSDTELVRVIKNASISYIEMEQLINQLAEIRRLKVSGLSDRIVEYNPSQHEMVDGYKAGVREVRVIRDGVTKDFDGRIKTIVKCWVESIE